MSNPVVEYLLTIVALGAGLWIVFALGIAGLLRVMEGAGVNRLDGLEARSALENIVNHGFADQPWLNSHEFDPLGVFRISNFDMAVWQRKGERTYLSFYNVFPGRRMVDVDSILDDGCRLITGNSWNIHALPMRPGVWMQSIAVKDIAELCRYHDMGVWFLTQSTGARPSRGDMAIEEEIIHSTKSQCAYVKSLPMWLLRLPYWYFVRRFRLSGKTVREQYECQRSLAFET